MPPEERVLVVTGPVAVIPGTVQQTRMAQRAWRVIATEASL